MTRVVILGGGPAGLGAAYRLGRSGRARATVLERGPALGGNASSFEWNGHLLDFGSHRLHPACDPEILSDLRRLLGDDLLDRPRHGRIRLLGRWIHFPLKPVNVALKAPPSFLAGVTWNMASRLWRRRREPDVPSFATRLESRLGRTICRDFYLPYARKIWGRAPEELSVVQAERRVSAGSFGKLLRKLAGRIPGFRRPGAGRFFYPREGFGSICRALAREARAAGADIRTGHSVTAVERVEGGGGWRVRAESPEGDREFAADHVWSTIPVTRLVGMLRPSAPAPVLDAAGALRFRALALVYLELGTDRFTEYDAHYFPGPEVRITRLSEPKNYAVRTAPEGRTVLCAELPCDAGDETWNLPDEELARLVARDLEASGLPLAAPPVAHRVVRLPNAYPIYLRGFEAPFAAVDRYVGGLDGIISFGRQGLFAHDNTHHALRMAWAAADCLGESGFDLDRWRVCREEFEGHVVED